MRWYFNSKGRYSGHSESTTELGIGCLVPILAFPLGYLFLLTVPLFTLLFYYSFKSDYKALDQSKENGKEYIPEVDLNSHWNPIAHPFIWIFLNIQWIFTMYFTFIYTSDKL